MRMKVAKHRDKAIFKHTAVDYTRKLNTMAFRGGIRL